MHGILREEDRQVAYNYEYPYYGNAEYNNDWLIATLKQEIADRKEGDRILQENLDAEEAARKAADGVLQEHIDEEAAAREAADEVLQENIDAEEAARKAEDEALQRNIDTEAAAREAADTVLQQHIDAEAAAREAADKALQENIDFNDIQVRNYIDYNINKEKEAREAADEELQENISAEEAARKAADTVLKNALDAEASAREAEDTSLAGRIDSTQGADFDSGIMNNAALYQYITQEATDRETQDTALRTALEQEITDRTAADASLDARVSTNASAIAATQGARFNPDLMSNSDIFAELHEGESSVFSRLDMADAANAQNAEAINDIEGEGFDPETMNNAALYAAIGGGGDPGEGLAPRVAALETEMTAVQGDVAAVQADVTANAGSGFDAATMNNKALYDAIGTAGNITELTERVARNEGVDFNPETMNNAALYAAIDGGGEPGEGLVERVSELEVQVATLNTDMNAAKYDIARNATDISDTRGIDWNPATMTNHALHFNIEGLAARCNTIEGLIEDTRGSGFDKTVMNNASLYERIEGGEGGPGLAGAITILQAQMADMINRVTALETAIGRYKLAQVVGALPEEPDENTIYFTPVADAAAVVALEEEAGGETIHDKHR